MYVILAQLEFSCSGGRIFDRDAARFHRTAPENAFSPAFAKAVHRAFDRVQHSFRIADFQGPFDTFARFQNFAFDACRLDAVRTARSEADQSRLIGF